MYSDFNIFCASLSQQGWKKEKGVAIVTPFLTTSNLADHKQSNDYKFDKIISYLTILFHMFVLAFFGYTIFSRAILWRCTPLSTESDANFHRPAEDSGARMLLPRSNLLRDADEYKSPCDKINVNARINSWNLAVSFRDDCLGLCARPRLASRRPRKCHFWSKRVNRSVRGERA